MARNLSPLLPDAFAIYSEAYVKIGELGVKVTDLDGSPSQPKKINQLIESTILYGIVSEAIILNDDGDAIIGIKGSVQTTNNLLLKLKRSVGLHSLPAFPTPLTEIVFINKCECEGGGTGGGCKVPDQIDTSGSTLVFDMEDECSKMFYGSADIDGHRTWSVLNTSIATDFSFSFVIDGSLNGSSHDQTLPANFKMSDARYISSTKKWRPYEAGEYFAKATTFNNGLTWKLEITDVFT